MKKRRGTTGQSGDSSYPPAIGTHWLFARDYLSFGFHKQAGCLPQPANPLKTDLFIHPDGNQCKIFRVKISGRILVDAS
jgi:hypothetical protein